LTSDCDFKKRSSWSELAIGDGVSLDEQRAEALRAGGPGQDGLEQGRPGDDLLAQQWLAELVPR